MSVESALFFETVEEIYGRVFRTLKPRTPIPPIYVRFRPYANANSRIQLTDGKLIVDISDLLQGAPAPVQEALAIILISKLFRKIPDNSVLARYRRYFDRAEIRRVLHSVKRTRGRKAMRQPKGEVYDLCQIFEDLNFRYFHGLMARPELGWGSKPSKTTLGHYDPSHNAIVLTNLLDSRDAKPLIVEYVMFHEMLHVRFPTEHRRGSRRCIHTPEFKAAERGFERFEEAKRELRAFVEKLR